MYGHSRVPKTDGREKAKFPINSSCHAYVIVRCYMKLALIPLVPLASPIPEACAITILSIKSFHFGNALPKLTISMS